MDILFAIFLKGMKNYVNSTLTLLCISSMVNYISNEPTNKKGG